MMDAPAAIVGAVVRTVRQVSGGQRDSATVIMDRLKLWNYLSVAIQAYEKIPSATIFEIRQQTEGLGVTTEETEDVPVAYAHQQIDSLFMLTDKLAKMEDELDPEEDNKISKLVGEIIRMTMLLTHEEAMHSAGNLPEKLLNPTFVQANILAQFKQ